MNSLFEIVHEDTGLLVVNKPAGLVCHPTKGDAFSSLIGRLRLYLGEEVATVHLINRLDRETSGLVLVAKTDFAAAGMRRRWEAGAVAKTYIAIVEGRVRTDDGEIDLPIGPDVNSAVAIRGCVRPDGAPSQTYFRRISILRSSGIEYSVLEVHPRSGRKHQIRIHLAHLGHPIVGDKIYGWSEECYLAFVAGRLDAEQKERLRLSNQALHAGVLEWSENGVARRYQAPLSFEMQAFIDRSEAVLEGVA